MSALRVVGIALAAVMMTLVLKKENGAAALAVSVAAGVIVLLSAVSDITYLVSYLRGLVAKTPTAAEGLGILLKCVGIGYITAFGASVCSDMGEKGLADKVTFVGRILVLVTGLPLVTSFIDTVGEILC